MLWLWHCVYTLLLPVNIFLPVGIVWFYLLQIKIFMNKILGLRKTKTFSSKKHFDYSCSSNESSICDCSSCESYQTDEQSVDFDEPSKDERKQNIAKLFDHFKYDESGSVGAFMTGVLSCFEPGRNKTHVNNIKSIKDIESKGIYDRSNVGDVLQSARVSFHSISSQPSSLTIKEVGKTKQLQGSVNNKINYSKEPRTSSTSFSKFPKNTGENLGNGKDKSTITSQFARLFWKKPFKNKDWITMTYGKNKRRNRLKAHKQNIYLQTRSKYEKSSNHAFSAHEQADFRMVAAQTEPTKTVLPGAAEIDISVANSAQLYAVADTIIGALKLNRSPNAHQLSSHVSSPSKSCPHSSRKPRLTRVSCSLIPERTKKFSFPPKKKLTLKKRKKKSVEDSSPVHMCLDRSVTLNEKKQLNRLGRLANLKNQESCKLLKLPIKKLCNTKSNFSGDLFKKFEREFEAEIARSKANRTHIQLEKTKNRMSS